MGQVEGQRAIPQSASDQKGFVPALRGTTERQACPIVKPRPLGGIVTSLSGSSLGFLVLVSVLCLILGCFLDITSMMVVTLPFILPVVRHFDIDPIWFGIILIKPVEISVVTPPVGLNLFAVLGAVDPDTRYAHVVRGGVPFILLELLVLALLILLPQTTLWLPAQMM